MPKTTREDIQTRLLQGYDSAYYASLYRQMRYAFGDDWNRQNNTAGGVDGSFPDFPEITVQYLKTGRSRRILNSQFTGLARVMSVDPEPEFPQVDKYTGEVRKQYYLNRWREGNFAEAHASAYMDGDGLGYGFVHWGLETNPKTDYQRTTCEYSPAVLTLWDRQATDPGRARWVCFVKYLAIDQAASLFGWKTAKKYRRQMSENGNFPVECVRLFEYYDTGYGPKGTPTRAVIPADLGSEPILIEDNPFERLPFSYMMYFTAPGMKRATGRIVMQMSTQEGLNDIEAHLRKVLKSPTFDIVDVTQLNTDDLRRVNAGDYNVKVRLDTPRPDAPPYIRVPGAEVAQTILALRDMYERQFNADSGTTDFDRGNLTTEKRTLGENQLLDSRSQNQQAWGAVQAVKMHQRSVETCLSIAKEYDRDPMLVDIFGQNVPINDPAEPRSWLSAFLEEPSNILISDQQLRARDQDAQRQKRMAELDSLFPLVQAGYINPQKWTEEKLKAAGEQDPQDWAPQPVAAGPEMGGDPSMAGLPNMMGAPV